MSLFCFPLDGLSPHDGKWLPSTPSVPPPALGDLPPSDWPSLSPSPPEPITVPGETKHTNWPSWVPGCDVAGGGRQAWVCDRNSCPLGFGLRMDLFSVLSRVPQLPHSAFLTCLPPGTFPTKCSMSRELTLFPRQLVKCFLFTCDWRSCSVASRPT